VIVEVFYGTLALFHACCESGRTIPYAKIRWVRGAFFSFLSGAYGPSIGTEQGYVKSRARAGVAKDYRGAQTSFRIHRRRLTRQNTLCQV
jgi:hypothetical protein